MVEAGEDEPGKPGNKTSRNEGRKLMATFLNNVGVGWALAALLQPTLSVLREGRGFGLADALSAFLFGVIAIMFVVAAQVVVARLEE